VTSEAPSARWTFISAPATKPRSSSTAAMTVISSMYAGEVVIP
jgi:hypothetical protein